jgi:hypothetical protein
MGRVMLSHERSNPLPWEGTVHEHHYQPARTHTGNVQGQSQQGSAGVVPSDDTGTGRLLPGLPRVAALPLIQTTALLAASFRG